MASMRNIKVDDGRKKRKRRIENLKAPLVRW